MLFANVSGGGGAERVGSRRTRKEIRSEIRKIQALIPKDRTEIETKRKYDDLLDKIKEKDQEIRQKKRNHQSIKRESLRIYPRIHIPLYHCPFGSDVKDYYNDTELECLQDDWDEVDTEIRRLSSERFRLYGDMRSLRNEVNAPHWALKILQEEFYQLGAPARDAERIGRSRVRRDGDTIPVPVSQYQMRNALETQSLLQYDPSASFLIISTDLPGQSSLRQVVNTPGPTNASPLGAFAYILLRDSLVTTWTSQGSTVLFLADVMILQFGLALVRFIDLGKHESLVLASYWSMATGRCRL